MNKKNSFIRLGLKLKLTCFILVLSLFPTAFIGYQAYNQQKDIITKEVTENHKELSNILANGIYENLHFTRILLSSITDLKAIRNINTHVAQDFFYSLLNKFSIFKAFYLIDSNKKIVFSTDPDIKISSERLYSNAIKRSYHGSLSQVFTTPDGTNYMTLESIIRSPEMHGFNGILVAEVNLSNISEILKKALKNSRSQGLVLDDNGKVIAKSSTATNVYNITAAETAKTDITKLKNLNGEPFLITAVSLKKFDFYQAPSWTIVLQIPEKVAFQAAYTFRTRILRILLITAIISIILSILLAQNFTAPLQNLIEGARQISKGDFSHHISPASDDEIGDLTRTFDEMRLNLRSTKADLEYRIIQLSTLYDVGKAISSVLEFKKLQHKILETAVKVVQAEKGSIMLLDDKVLTIGVAVGLSEEITKKTRLEAGQSISGWVVDQQKPLFIKDVKQDKTFLSIKKDEVKAGTLMCVPLIAKEKLLGVLNVSRVEPNSFSEKDFELFVNLANQAAIAIENARLYRYAVTDEMTRLYNHRYFQQRLDEELLRADRYDNHVSLIILDVDHFKNFNDTYGHPEGDRVLKTVARLIEKSVREVDISARYGGEEFVVICPEKNAEGSLPPAERIRNAVAEYDFRIKGEPVPITVSLGVASYPDQAKSKPELIKKADYALYFSKNNGRNQANLYNPIMNRD